MLRPMQPAIEHVPLPSESGFYCKHVDVSRGWPFMWHAHPEAELTLILRGRGRRYVGDHIEPFEAGDLVLVGSGLPHTWHSSTRRRAEAIVLQLRPAWLDTVASLGVQMQPVRRLVQQASVGRRFSQAAERRIHAAMVELPKQRGPRQIASVLGVLADLSAARKSRPLSSEAFAAKATRRRSWQHPSVDAAVKFVEKHLAATGLPPTQAATARAVHSSPSAFSRLFNQSTGRSFTHYLHELRVGNACRLLLETDDAVTAVAHASGFANLANFNRVFKRLRGTTPREFRRQFKQDA